MSRQIRHRILYFESLTLLLVAVLTPPVSGWAQPGSATQSMLNPEIAVNIAAVGGYSTREAAEDEVEG